jgi:hypothetical protein
MSIWKTITGDPSFDAVSQLAHASLAAFLVLAAHGNWWVVGTVIAFAMFKEFWWDYRFETEVCRGSSPRDFGFYMAGVAIGLLATLIPVF